MEFTKRSTNAFANPTVWYYQELARRVGGVGYLEKKDNVYYFANCIQIESSKLNDTERAIQLDLARREITFQILDDLKLTSQ